MSTEPELSLAALEDCVRRRSRLTFAKSGGRGGQNVNKVSTKVLARVTLGSLEALSEEQKERVRAKLANRITDRDELIVFADGERSQARNREIVLARAVELIAKAAHRPRPRRPTRPTRSSKLERLESKKRQGLRKRSRKAPADQ
jgi:ribosome-associated protein